MKKRIYLAEEYIPHIECMLNKGIQFSHIRIAGGEPFLHPDLLGFAKELRRYAKLTIASNLFWLKNKESLKKYSELFSLIDIFFPSLYPGQNKLDLIKEIEQQWSHLTVSYRPKPVFISFNFVEFPENVKNFCDSQGGCVNLLVDGRLSRCATAAFADVNPNVTNVFLNHRNDIFFDLYKDKNIITWRNKWPLDACAYCTLWKNEKVNWQKYDSS